LWPTVGLGLFLRTLVPGIALFQYGMYVLPLAAAVHVAAHVLYSNRRRRSLVYATPKVLSHVAFGLFWLLQVEQIQLRSLPVGIWLLSGVFGRENLPDGPQLDHLLWNLPNAIAASPLVCVYLWMLLTGLFYGRTRRKRQRTVRQLQTASRPTASSSADANPASD